MSVTCGIRAGCHEGRRRGARAPRILGIMDRRCLIAGCGYVGRRLAAQLQLTWQVVALARSPATLARLRADGLETLAADLDVDPPPAAAAMLADGAAVAYLAPPPGTGTADVRLERFLTALGSAQPAVFVYMSTTGVYGDTAGGVVDELSPVAPANDRSRRRLSAERAATAWCDARGVRSVVLRVPGIYGPGRLPLERLHRGEPALRPEDAGPGNRIHVDDLVEACVAAIEGPANGVYNVGDGDHASTTEFLQTTALLAGLPPPRLVSRKDAAGQISPGMLEYLVESRRVVTRRMREELGVMPRFATLAAGIAASLAEMHSVGD
jgi:nucleoside-diphosphate-sugar epimerase